MKQLKIACTAVAISMLCAAPISVHWTSKTAPALAFDTADARIGRPLTPMSVAGVNRRMHRRAYRAYSYGHPYTY